MTSTSNVAWKHMWCIVLSYHAFIVTNFHKVNIFFFCVSTTAVFIVIIIIVQLNKFNCYTKFFESFHEIRAIISDCGNNFLWSSPNSLFMSYNSSAVRSKVCDPLKRLQARATDRRNNVSASTQWQVTPI